MAVFASNSIVKTGWTRPPIGGGPLFSLWGVTMSMLTTNSWLLESLNLYLANYVPEGQGGSAPGGVVTAYIYLADLSGFPTGSPLASGSIDQGDLSTITTVAEMWQASGTFYFVSINPHIVLTKLLSYCIVLTASVYAANGYTIIYQNNSPTDAGYSVNGQLIKYNGGWSINGGAYGGSGLIYQASGIEIPEGAPIPLTDFPTDRPNAYDPDLTWQPGSWDGSDYTDDEFASDYQAAGGGRWSQQLVVAGNDRIYYEDRE